MKLADVIDKCRGSTGRAPVVVFDLDGTLFDNGPRTWQILLDFAEHEGHRELRRALDNLPRHGLPYLLRDTLARCGIHDEALTERARRFWMERFFTDDFQRYDEPIPGSVRYVRALFEAGATIVYLSGRDSPNMLVGCAASLRRNEFPIGIPRTALVLKHAFEDDDLTFKRESLAFIEQLGEVAGTFDNEPANCNLFAERWPNALHFLLETNHAPNPPALVPAVTRTVDLSHG